MSNSAMLRGKLTGGIFFPLISVAALVGMVGCGGSSSSNSDDSVLPQADQPIPDSSELDPAEPDVSDVDDQPCSGLSLGFDNLGAESIEPATSEDQFAVLTSWDIVSGNTSSTLYGMGGYPTASEGQGSRLFTGGNEDVSVATQTTVLAANVVGCRFLFSAELGGFANQEDNATVEISFIGSSEDVLSTMILGPVTAEDRGNETALLPMEATGNIPNTAVLARITITQNRLSGSANDGYLDNIAVTLN